MTDEIAQPVSLGDLAREGRLLWCYCLACCHEREVDPLSLGLDPAEAVSTVGKRLEIFEVWVTRDEQSRSCIRSRLRCPIDAQLHRALSIAFHLIRSCGLCSSWRKRRRRMSA